VYIQGLSKTELNLWKCSVRSRTILLCTLVVLGGQVVSVLVIEFKVHIFRSGQGR
jgi:hypothetical protein